MANDAKESISKDLNLILKFIKDEGHCTIGLEQYRKVFPTFRKLKEFCNKNHLDYIHDNNSGRTTFRLMNLK